MSHLARVNYNYRGRYYLTATMRRDGASNFSSDNKWAFFLRRFQMEYQQRALHERLQQAERALPAPERWYFR